MINGKIVVNVGENKQLDVTLLDPQTNESELKYGDARIHTVEGKQIVQIWYGPVEADDPNTGWLPDYDGGNLISIITKSIIDTNPNAIIRIEQNDPARLA